MANFDVQILDLITPATIDQAAMDGWAADGAREIINMMPPNLKEMCYQKNTFTSSSVGSESETINTQEINSVYAGTVKCRMIDPKDKFKAADANSIHLASATDPVYYIEGGKLNILPASSSGIYYAIANPSVDVSNVDTIANFPNELEYLVVLYVAIKIAESQLIAEEDVELYTPIITTLKQDYMQGIQNSSLVQKQQQGAK